jgi:hypothetical protein
MQHVHDELNYLNLDQIILLNDKYLSEYKSLSIKEIRALIYEFETLLDLVDKDEIIDEEVKSFNRKISTIKIKRVHLYQIKINCLYEQIDRKVSYGYKV